MRYLISLVLLLLVVSAQSQTLTSQANLGLVTFQYTTPSTASSVQLQLYVDNVDQNAWVLVNPGGNYAAASGQFSSGMAKGHYHGARLLLFVAGTNFSQVAGDYFIANWDQVVTTSQLPILSPTMTFGAPYVGSDGQMHVPYTLKYPQNTPQPPSNGLWVMARYGGVGQSGFQQSWASLAGAKAGTDPLDTYLRLDGELLFTKPTPGVINIQGGAFDANWNIWATWIWPGVDTDLGDASWVPHCDPYVRPTAKQIYTHPGGAPFSIGGDLGNYSVFSNYGSYANYGDPVYIRLLVRAVGVLWLRENISADRYLTDTTYRHIIRSHAETMWLMGIVPILAFQDEPQGASLAARDNALIQADTLLASDYADAPGSIWLENCNEPYEHPTWLGDWAPLAKSTLTAMLAVDPKGCFLCATEGYGKSAIAAGLNPLPTNLTTLYDLHAYISPTQFAQAIPSSGIQILVGEYHDTSDAFHQALKPFHNIVGIGAWAWSEPGQDSLPLASGLQGYSLGYTPDGAALVLEYNALRAGK